MVKVHCGKKFNFDSGNGITGSGTCGMFMLWTTMQCDNCKEKEKEIERISEGEKE